MARWLIVLFLFVHFLVIINALKIKTVFRFVLKKWYPVSWLRMTLSLKVFYFNICSLNEMFDMFVLVHFKCFQSKTLFPYGARERNTFFLNT